MIDALTVLAILAIASFLLWRQFRRDCGCDSNNAGSSCCQD